MWDQNDRKMVIKIKIAITSTGKGLQAKTSPVFGRCPYFVLVEIEDSEIKNSETIENPGINQQGGAGTAAAQKIGNNGAEAVISPPIGPHAFNVLQQLDIDPYQEQKGTIKENVNHYLKGNLKKVEKATRGAGRGKGRGRGSFKQ